MRNYSARANISVKILLLVVSALVLLLSACTSDENEAFIQGNWFYNDQHIQEQIGETFSETYWSFDRGTYETYTCMTSWRARGISWSWSCSISTENSTPNAPRSPSLSSARRTRSACCARVLSPACHPRCACHPRLTLIFTYAIVFMWRR